MSALSLLVDWFGRVCFCKSVENTWSTVTFEGSVARLTAMYSQPVHIGQLGTKVLDSVSGTQRYSWARAGYGSGTCLA